MILQALVRYYQVLIDQGKISSLGWSNVKVSYVLSLDIDGTVLQVIPVLEEQKKGKKTVMVPRFMELPSPVKRSSGVSPNFLCDTSSYILGVDKKGKPERVIECFQACKNLHLQILSNVETPAAQAVKAFFASWQPESAASHPALAPYWNEITGGCNLAFWYTDNFAQNDPSIHQAWDKIFQQKGEGEEMICLVTGEKGPVEKTHLPIKNVRGAQSSGAALVSFNAPAFCSYGKEQNLNAPTGKYAAFAYTAALNALLADRDHVYQIGDTTVVCWSENGERAYQDLAGWSFLNQETHYSFEDMQNALHNLCQGKTVYMDTSLLDPDMEFYILGLAPNTARLSVRFFYKNSFGNFLKNAQKHQDRLKIGKPVFDKAESIPIWKLLSETVNPNSKDKTPAPNMAGEVFRSVLNDTPYPATLMNGVILRIRAERKVTRGRAAIIKAYYLKNIHPQVPKEVLTVSLNAESTNIPYNLGRLFSVLEGIQLAANPGINTTIKDKYFNSASSIPSVIFPVLINLAQKHLRKLDGGLEVYYRKQVGELMNKLGEEFPVRLDLHQQGAFQLGYYQQTQARYEKKEDK
jgi:CRISPR-associated protein Csd1